MSDAREAHLFELAARRLDNGDSFEAIEILRRMLSDDPDHAGAHALLALALLATKRIHAAQTEADMALTLAPEDAFAHLAAGSVAVAHRQLRKAEEHARQAIDFSPELGAARRLRARIQVFRGELEPARKTLEEALALEPESPEILVALGELDLAQGRLDSAERRAREALSLEPEHVSALALMGEVLLARGDVEGAREHAVWALRSNATDEDALRLLASIKTRQNLFLGLWWRYNTWLGRMGEASGALVLVGAYLAYRTGTIFADQQALPMTAGIVRLAWLAACIYTWVGPGMFDRAVRKELKQVALRPDF